MTNDEDRTMNDDFDATIARHFELIDQIPAPDVWRRVTGEERQRHVAAGGGRRPAVLLVAAAVLSITVAGVIAIASRGNDPEPSARPSMPTTVGPGTGTSVAGGTASTFPGVYGTAVPSPAIVERGGTLTVTPAGEIVPTCTRIALVSTSPASGQEPIGQLKQNGEWVPISAGASPTWLGCLEYPTTDSMMFQIPDDLADGTYVICLTEPATEAGCTTFQVAANDTPATAPVAAGPGQWRPADVRDEQVTVSADGRELTLSIRGGAEYSPDNPCSMDVRAAVEESASEVRVRIMTRSAADDMNILCLDTGYTRTVTVHLESPLGGRPVKLRSTGRRLSVSEEG